jgi:hypothetical protein
MFERKLVAGPELKPIAIELELHPPSPTDRRPPPTTTESRAWRVAGRGRGDRAAGRRQADGTAQPRIKGYQGCLLFAAV